MRAGGSAAAAAAAAAPDGLEEEVDAGQGQPGVLDRDLLGDGVGVAGLQVADLDALDHAEVEVDLADRLTAGVVVREPDGLSDRAALPRGQQRLLEAALAGLEVAGDRDVPGLVLPGDTVDGVEALVVDVLVLDNVDLQLRSRDLGHGGDGHTADVDGEVGADRHAHGSDLLYSATRLVPPWSCA